MRPSTANSRSISRDFERRRRLVEDQQPAAPAQRLGDGDKLALRERQAVHAGVRVRREIELRQGLARPIPHRVAVDDGHAQQAPHRRTVKRQVLGNRQRRNQTQLLRNGDDAGGDRVVRTAEPAWAAVNRDFTAVGAMHAAEDPHQRRLAGAVFADQRMNFARHRLEIDAVERARRAEML